MKPAFKQSYRFMFYVSNIILSIVVLHSWDI